MVGTLARIVARISKRAEALLTDTVRRPNLPQEFAMKQMPMSSDTHRSREPLNAENIPIPICGMIGLVRLLAAPRMQFRA